MRARGCVCVLYMSGGGRGAPFLYLSCVDLACPLRRAPHAAASPNCDPINVVMAARYALLRQYEDREAARGELDSDHSTTDDDAPSDEDDVINTDGSVKAGEMLGFVDLEPVRHAGTRESSAVGCQRYRKQPTHARASVCTDVAGHYAVGDVALGSHAPWRSTFLHTPWNPSLPPTPLAHLAPHHSCRRPPRSNHCQPKDRYVDFIIPFA